MRCLFLYHEGSGRGTVARKLPLIKRRLSRRYQQVDIVCTTSADELMTHVREGMSTYDAVVFSCCRQQRGVRRRSDIFPRERSTTSHARSASRGI